MYSHIKYLLIILSFGIQFGFAQIPPSLDCIDRSGTNDAITWNDTYGVMCDTFVLWRASAASGPYTPLDTFISPISGTVKTHAGIDQWYYLSCFGTLSPTSDTVDNINPETPPLESVSVGSQNDTVFIDWGMSPSPETFGYIIYLEVGSTVVEIDTVLGRFNTFYAHTGSSPQTQSEKYFVNSIDSCFNRGVISLDPQNTIFLQNIDLDSCAQTAKLDWSAYQNWIGGVIEYQVLLSVNGDTFGVVSPSGLQALTFTYSGLTANDTLCFKIRAIGPGGFSALSNTRCLDFAVVTPSTFSYLNSLNVSQNNSVILRWLADSLADINRFSIQRSTNGSDFSEVFSMMPPANLNTVLTFKDQNIFPNEQPYYYRLQTFDDCGNYILSNRVRTIHVQGNPLDFVNNIEWSGIFLGTTTFDNGTYEIFRKVNGNWTPVPIDTVQTFEPAEYSDSIHNVFSATGKYDYLVVAKYRETVNNTMQIAHSNVTTLAQPWQVACPNAITPDGVVPINRVFKCAVSFVDVYTYQLQIFNRGGQLIFETQDQNIGWDGTYKGKDVPQGLYVFKLTMTDKDGFPFNEKGTVLVIR